MENLEQLYQNIENINTKISENNKNRQIAIGRQEALQKQLSDALANYEKLYGYALTVDTISAEIERVVAEINQTKEHIDQIFAMINAGNYAEANRLAGVEVKTEDIAPETLTETLATPVAEVPTAPVVEETAAEPVAEVPTTPVVEETVAEEPVAEKTTDSAAETTTKGKKAFKEKECPECHKMFVPRSGRQVLCDECKEKKNTKGAKSVKEETTEEVPVAETPVTETPTVETTATPISIDELPAPNVTPLGQDPVAPLGNNTETAVPTAPIPTATPSAPMTPPSAPTAPIPTAVPTAPMTPPSAPTAPMTPPSAPMTQPSAPTAPIPTAVPTAPMTPPSAPTAPMTPPSAPTAPIPTAVPTAPMTPPSAPTAPIPTAAPTAPMTPPSAPMTQPSAPMTPPSAPMTPPSVPTAPIPTAVPTAPMTPPSAPTVPPIGAAPVTPEMPAHTPLNTTTNIDFSQLSGEALS